MADPVLTHESIVQRIVDILDADLNDVIDTLNTQLGGTPLPHPLKIFFGERQIDTLIKLDSNVGSVISDREDTENDQGGYDEENWFFSIAMILRAETKLQKVMEKWAMRMKDAIRITIDQHPVLDFQQDPNIKVVTRVGTSVTPLEKHGGLLFKAIIQELNVKVVVCHASGW